MVETISPMVHGGRNTSYYRAVALHASGAALSASALGLALGVVGAAADAPWGTAGGLFLMSIAILYAVRELTGIHIPLPDLDRQVPLWWRSFFGRGVAAFLYGLGLGVGFITYLSFGTLVAVAAAAVVSGSPAIGAMVMAPFGVARGLSVLAVGGGSPDELLDRLEQSGLRRKAALGNGLALLGMALSALGEL
jgi:hypothetical protein